MVPLFVTLWLKLWGSVSQVDHSEPVFWHYPNDLDYLNSSPSCVSLAPPKQWHCESTRKDLWFLQVRLCCSAPSSVPATGPQHVLLSLSARPFGTLPHRDCNREKPAAVQWASSSAVITQSVVTSRPPASAESVCWLDRRPPALAVFLRCCVYTVSLLFFFLNIELGLSGVTPQMAWIKSKSTLKVVGLACWKIFTFHCFNIVSYIHCHHYINALH